MKDQPENPLDPNQLAEQSAADLEAENEVLKLKLEMDFGMEMNYAATLNPAAENKWLRHIYEFEKQYKDAKRTKVFDRLGRPSFIKTDDLTPEQIKVELQRFFDLMEQKGLALDCPDDYDPAVIYRFITEELFEHEFDDIAMEGFVHHFIYEEFRPGFM
jgi:hypothetical protein